ncbi:C40 family peptidase [Parapedobacter koreensis]|uniref:Lipoprotein Spr n=1 Tax=Parapedobacter koreensis TaxID=332977 RepID=A0A1H7TS77_9SPHI|nr:NlpC/P60 family protein [Parapedobacter koreensis]SEL87493.1 lipoprotein Spr [Parapedobacter koreensis]
MTNSLIHPKAYIALCLSLSVFLLSGCLTRKNALPPDKATVSTRSKKAPSRNTILTDASSAPRDVRATGRGLIDGYAQVLGVRPQDLQNVTLYTYIDDWMGIPHRSGGVDRRGLDCSAFVGMVMRDVYGKSVPRVSKEMAEHIKRKYERQLQEGDLVFFSFGRRDIDHVGIYLHNNKFVHVSTTKGVIISDLHDSWYYKYFKRAGSVR